MENKEDDGKYRWGRFKFDTLAQLQLFQMYGKTGYCECAECTEYYKKKEQEKEKKIKYMNRKINNNVPKKNKKIHKIHYQKT